MSEESLFRLSWFSSCLESELDHIFTNAELGQFSVHLLAFIHLKQMTLNTIMFLLKNSLVHRLIVVTTDLL